MFFFCDMSLEELQESVQKNPFEIDPWLALIQRVASEDCVENALDEIFVAEEIFPENHDIQAIKSLCLMSLGEVREAHDLLQQTLRRSPGDALVARVLDDFLPQFKEISQDQLLNPWAIREHIRAEPFQKDFLERLDSTIDLIQLFNENESYPERLVDPLERHVEKLPQDINARLDLARLCHNIGRPGKATRHYQIVLQLDPLCASAWFELATIEPDPGAAIEFSQRGLDLCPDFECGRYNYAALLLKSGMLDEGRNEMLRLPADSPWYIPGLKAIAHSHGDQGTFEEAIRVQEKVVALCRDNAEAWNCYGHFFAQLGDYSTALEHFDRAIGIDSEHLDALHNRALVLGNLDRHEEAIDVLKYALVIEPDNDALLVNLAVELSDCGRVAEAIELTENSLKRFPQHVNMWLNLGSFHFQSGQLHDSIACSQKAVALDPARAAAWWNLARAYAGLGKHAQCLAALKASMERNPKLALKVANEKVLRDFLGDAAFQELLQQHDSGRESIAEKSGRKVSHGES